MAVPARSHENGSNPLCSHGAPAMSVCRCDPANLGSSRTTGPLGRMALATSAERQRHCCLKAALLMDGAARPAHGMIPAGEPNLR